MHQNQPKKHFFPDRLRKQLNQIPHHPATIVEAPSGFGKTTAVSQYLKENLPEGVMQLWFTCLGEPVPLTWNGICDLLSRIDEKAAGSLKKLKISTMENLISIRSILKSIQCSAETYMVIDNYQLFYSDVRRELASAFSMHGNPNLHFIFIAQHLGREPRRNFHNIQIHTIGAPDFFFDAESTARLFRTEGIRLSKEELDKAFACTEGWVAAISLQVANYKENGSFGLTDRIERLVEAAILNDLTTEEREFLLSVSVMDSFNPRQASVMLGTQTLPENIEELLKSNHFIRYSPDKGAYTMHGTLRDYLRNRFFIYESAEYQKRIASLAGHACAAISQYYAAARLFFSIGDFDAILSLPIDAKYILDHKEENMLEFIRELVDRCPEETLLKYPHAMLTFCLQMFAGGHFEAYRKLYRLIGLIIKANDTLSPDELCRIKRGHAFIFLLESYINSGRIKGDIENALVEPEISGCQIEFGVPFPLGCPSVLFLFWRERGRLEKELADAEESLKIIRKLVRGYGFGAESVMKAEAMLLRGEDDEAEILCHKAIYQARSQRQTCICLCAELVLARIAILRGDANGYFAALRNIRSYAQEDSDLHIRRMADLCLAAVSLYAGSTENVAPWLYDMTSIQKTLYYPAVPYAQVLYSILLFNEKRYNEFLGLAQAILDAGADIGGNLRCMMPKVYFYKYLAAVNLRNGSLREAENCFRQALEMSLPDKNYLPIVQNSDTLNIPVLIELAKSGISDKEGISALTKLCRQQERGTAAIKRALLRGQTGLTPREREIALLVRKRLSAQEIADKLYISKATVKTIIKNIYRKLEIHSRSELDKIEI